MEKMMYSTKEVAALLGIHSNTVRNMVRDGHLPALVIGTSKHKIIRVPAFVIKKMINPEVK